MARSLGVFFWGFLPAIVLDFWDLELCVYIVRFFPAEKLEWNGLIEVAACQVLCREEQGSGGRRWLEKGSGGANGDIYELRGARAIYIGARYTKKQI